MDYIQALDLLVLQKAKHDALTLKLSALVFSFFLVLGQLRPVWRVMETGVASRSQTRRPWLQLVPPHRSSAEISC